MPAKPKPAPRLKKEYPTDKTLDKYGLSRDEFHSILAKQGGVCPICSKVPSTGRWVIDHHHVKGWSKMSAGKRKEYVRGITCWFCNHYYLGRAINTEKAKNVVAYLQRYEDKWNSTRKSSFDGVIISASADVIGTEPTLTTPLYTTSSAAGKAVTRRSTIPATLYSSITVNTLSESLTQERGGKGSGKSKSNGTAKKK